MLSVQDLKKKIMPVFDRCCSLCLSSEPSHFLPNNKMKCPTEQQAAEKLLERRGFYLATNAEIQNLNGLPCNKTLLCLSVRLFIVLLSQVHRLVFYQCYIAVGGSNKYSVTVQ